MNIQQLEYILALDRHRNFVKASQACFVTQPTLSAMVLKLEDELDLKIFDRSRQPLVPTEEGKAVLNQARLIINQVQALKDLSARLHEEPEGEFRIGIIPTISTFLLPLFLSQFLNQYPKIKLIVSELTTASIIERLQNDEIDAGILATPVGSVPLIEHPVYQEEFVLYGSSEPETVGPVRVHDLDMSRLWLLEEGHCLRMQVVNLCDLRGHDKLHPNLEYQAGSLESLRRLVDANGGYTVLPALATYEMTAEQKRRLRYFQPPAPARQISVVALRPWSRKRHIELLVQAIQSAVGQQGLIQSSDVSVVPVFDLKPFNHKLADG